MPTKIEKDAVTGTDTTGHEWDGIKELNTPLPKWWLYVFYATIAWALVYCVLYPAWPSCRPIRPACSATPAAREITQELLAAQAARSAPVVDRIRARLARRDRGDPELLAFAHRPAGAPSSRRTARRAMAPAAPARAAFPTWPTTTGSGAARRRRSTRRSGTASATPDPESRQSQMPRFGVDGVLTAAADRATSPTCAVAVRPGRGEPAARSGARRSSPRTAPPATATTARAIRSWARRAWPTRSGSMAATRRRSSSSIANAAQRLDAGLVRAARRRHDQDADDLRPRARRRQVARAASRGRCRWIRSPRLLGPDETRSRHACAEGGASALCEPDQGLSARRSADAAAASSGRC